MNLDEGELCELFFYANKNHGTPINPKYAIHVWYFHLDLVDFYGKCG